MEKLHEPLTSSTAKDVLIGSASQLSVCQGEEPTPFVPAVTPVRPPPTGVMLVTVTKSKFE